ncbi:type II secretion system F family protein [Nocardiopsis sp. EMB25]|uniref:type II secretion system F family protein n=1 Tax=Nocardiopsis sp. EMB25 TaxID=2835867 RepID=UPI002283C0E9|nr:type II secretion system F family protein [Nocardiopsis sp. EMB25]MCY9787109.1 type II secretion system F family protein [Nocardiopsis sp. EMB25]
MGAVTPWWSGEVGGLAVAGALCGAGIACAAYAMRLLPWGAARAVPRRWVKVLVRRGLWLRAAGAIAAGALVGVVTGWPVGVVLAAAAGWWMPTLLGPDTGTRAEADIADALACWAEQLRDMITGASGLHQAITATVPIAPDLIRNRVQDLEARLRAGQSMEHAAAVFARDVNSDLGDLVAITLSMGASSQSGDVAGTLTRLAEAARERAVTVARVSASRARVRSSVRIITAATTLMLLGMVAFNPSFLAPVGTVSGQAVLAMAGGLWTASFLWLGRLAAPPTQPRPFRLAIAGGSGPGGVS